MSQVQCPHCNVTMEPERIQRGPTAGKPKCSSCGKGISVSIPSFQEPAKIEIGEQVMPKTDPNDPPVLEVAEKTAKVDVEQQPPVHRSAKKKPTMPEQAINEPYVPPPPTLELAEETVADNQNRPWTSIEEKWYQYSRRVKRIGGFVKGISSNEQATASRLAKELGTDVKNGWNDMPHIPRLMNASHAENQKALFEKPVKMVQVVKE